MRFSFDSSPLVLLSYRSSPRNSRARRRITLALASVVTFLLPAAALADTITLKNGDHITGAVSQMTGGKLTIHTDYADDVNIDFAKVTAVKIDKPVVLSIETKTGKKLSIREVQITAIDRTADGFAVTTISGTENMAAASVTTVRTPAAQQAYEASLRPGWLHDWTGVANLSLALARGNSDTTTLGVGVNLVRPTPTDKTSLYFNDIYTHDGILNSTTADHIGAGARYDYNLGPKFFLFGTADFATDQLQALDLRSVVGGGLGWHAITGDKQQLDLLAGLVWTHEQYGWVPPVPPSIVPIPPQTNSFAALDFGEQYTRKVGKNSVLTEQAYFFPNLQDTSEYRATGTLGLSTKIKSFLSWQTSMADVYVTNPPVGTKTNDFILTTGFGFNFARK